MTNRPTDRPRPWWHLAVLRARGNPATYDPPIVRVIVVVEHPDGTEESITYAAGRYGQYARIAADIMRTPHRDSAPEIEVTTTITITSMFSEYTSGGDGVLR